MRQHIEFFRQFRQNFTTTGAIAPSSRFLAKAITGPFRKRQQPARILEVGPGSGAFTREIVSQLREGEQFDLVELNEAFVEILNRRFANERPFQRVQAQANIHVCPLQEFQTEHQFDFIVSGLPLNNFSPELVREIFEVFFRLLAPGGVLSYFEYMYVRPIRKRVSQAAERTRLAQLDAVIQPYLQQHRIKQDWVFANLPPAWVQHLRRGE